MLRNCVIIATLGLAWTPVRALRTVNSIYKDETTTKASSEIIGSSVVTSVSVVLGDQPSDYPNDVPHPKTEIFQPGILTIESEEPFNVPSNNFVRSLPSEVGNHVIVRNKAYRKEEGVQSVIDTLKTIVQQEQQKHENTPQPTTSNTNAVQPVDETPPTSVTQSQPQRNKFVPGTSLNGEDDDEMESAGGSTSDPLPPTTDAINDFAKHVVSMSPDEQENDNDTATSAEVHDAIHKISGAILSIEGSDEKKRKPIEKIVNDVLTSINSARNTTVPEETFEQEESHVTPTSPATTKRPPKQKPTSARPSKPSSSKKGSSGNRKGDKKSTTTTTTTTTARTTKKPMQENNNKLKTELSSGDVVPTASKKTRPIPPQRIRLPTIIMLETDKPVTDEEDDKEEGSMNKYRIPGNGIPTDDDPFGSEDNDNQWQLAPTHGQQFDEPEHVPVEYTTLRPYVPPPSKAPQDNMWQLKRPVNESTSSTRPNEFYDDEIFGYDPYQTFFHGVYVPVVEVGTLAELQQEEQDDTVEEEEPLPVRATQRPRPGTKQGKPTPVRKRPVPTLPDHLHRPRPSHLQYQHGAADDTDPETGLLNPHYDHPGHSFVPDPEVSVPDKLVPQSQPLPPKVRKNFTDHHDHHVQHQHGLGGHGHGHDQGGHGHHGHGDHHAQLHHHFHEQASAEKRPSFSPAPNGNPGLEATLTSLDEEKRLFVDINNRLALRLLSSLTNPVSHSSTSYGNTVLSPFAITTSLGMLFLGARGQTAAQLDGLLQLDDMLTFNPHMMYHNVTEAFLSQPNTAAAIIRLLVTDKEKGDVLEFYKTRVQQFYEARVEEVDYKFAGHLAQSIINQMIRAQIQRHSYEMLNYSLPLMGPMSLITAMFFDGQFAGGRDTTVENMNFIHLAALQQGPAARRLFQVPAFALRGHFRAAYDKELDATSVEVPYTTRDLSLILIMPGKPGEFAFGGVTSLKSRLNLEAWTKLMRGFYSRDSFKLIVPRFRHQSGLNLSHTFNRLGLTDMFEPALAKFKGMNGLTDLYLDKNMMHFSEFGTWEKLSDTLTEANNRNLDLIRILRPHVREHYGNFGEPMSVNEWMFKHKQQDQGEQRSQPDPIHIVPDDVTRLRLELERLRRRQTNTHHSESHPQSQDRSWQYNPHQLKHAHTSYSKVRGSTVDFRPRRLKTSIKTQRSKVYYFRQDEPTHPSEQEMVLRFERPFLYILRHNPTGMILMTGQYTEPVTEVLD